MKVMLSLIRRWYTASKPTDPHYIQHGVCEDCKRLLRVRFILRFAAHLNEIHGLSEDEAIARMEHVAGLILEHKKNTKGEKHVSQ